MVTPRSIKVAMTRYLFGPLVVASVVLWAGVSESNDVVTRIAKDASPSVVTILALQSNGNVYAQGSGFVVSEDGVVVTCHHVVADAALLAVKFQNGDLYDEVGIIELDPRRDIAVLKIKAAGLSHVSFGDSNQVEVGQQVVAITSPKGLENSVADGRVSAVRDTGAGYQLFQVSVPVSEGSSGGAVFGMDGKVIGVASAQVVDGQNLNFAIPVNYVRPLVKTTVAKWLGRAAAVPNTSLAISASGAPEQVGTPPLAPPGTIDKVLRLPGSLSSVQSNGSIEVLDGYGYRTPMTVTRSTSIFAGGKQGTFEDLQVGMRVEVDYGSDSTTRKRYALEIRVRKNGDRH